MILYALACAAGHRFDSWFRDSAAFDEQVARGLVVCATCQSTEVVKTIMAPAVVAARRPGPPAEAAMDVALIDDKSREVRALLRSVRDKVVAEGDDVGPAFAAEARRMHEGETPVRQIYGQATPTDARDMIEEGIMILPMPIVPDELN